MCGYPFSSAHMYSPSRTVGALTLGWKKRPFSNLCISKPVSHQPLVHFNNRMTVWLPGREIAFIPFHFLPQIMFAVIWEASVFTEKRHLEQAKVFRWRSGSNSVTKLLFHAAWARSSLLRCLPAGGELDLLLNRKLKVKRIMDYGK